jgi:hypothetical protein
MPPLCFHLAIAKEAAELLHNPIIDRNLGNYLVGATLPDVHLIIGVSREETHFFDLEQEAGESGVRLIFKAHPNLAKGSKLDEKTKSLIAGYLSHLIADEVWIRDIYRPFFGSSSPLGGDPMANMLDRLLQYELDRREREDERKMEGIRALLCDWEPGGGVDFIDASTLAEWREFVSTATTRQPTWDLFPFFARRFLLPRFKVDPEQLEQFLSSMPSKLEWALHYVTPQRLTAFREKAISESVAVVKEYLGEDN